MSLYRVKSNLGFALAGAVLFGVLVNVFYELEINSEGGNDPVCLSTSTQ